MAVNTVSAGMGEVMPGSLEASVRKQASSFQGLGSWRGSEGLMSCLTVSVRFGVWGPLERSPVF